MMRKRLLLNNLIGGGNGMGDVGEIVLVNNKTLQKILVTQDELGLYVNTHTPIGLVAVPLSHNVYNLDIVNDKASGEIGVMSLKYMDDNNPEEGTVTPKAIYFSSVSGSTGLTAYSVLNRVSPATSNTLSSTAAMGSLPIGNTFGNYNVYSADGIARYYTGSTEGCPSPYLSNGLLNEVYYSHKLSKLNALSDFNGRTNTQQIIKNLGENARGPYCCSVFKTLGTNSGDWYLPSVGELGYVPVRQKKLDDSITSIINYWGETSASKIYWTTGNGCYTSTRSQNNMWLLDISTGLVNSTAQIRGTGCFRAFTRLKI